MKAYEGTDVRNVALIGHGHSGKTTLTAGLLYTAGATNRLTRVDEGNTVTDFDDDEIQRKLSISTAVAYAEWAKYAQVTFTQTNNSTGPETLAVLFASGAHGDGYPFDGPGGVLAHTFYPYPLNAEPIAGERS